MTNLNDIAAVPAFGPNGEPDGWTDENGDTWAPLEWNEGDSLPEGTPIGRIGMTKVFNVDYAAAVYAAAYFAEKRAA